MCLFMLRLLEGTSVNQKVLSPIFCYHFSIEPTEKCNASAIRTFFNLKKQKKPGPIARETGRAYTLAQSQVK